ncbi:hypothetical protein [Streptomyces sp. NPDC051098]|uniref:hypothetical protein n=1 Tax=Streptomyces sp. NPDC051098 TaxID=3155411 RepID=UPI003416FE4E
MIAELDDHRRVALEAGEAVEARAGHRAGLGRVLAEGGRHDVEQPHLVVHGQAGDRRPEQRDPARRHVPAEGVEVLVQRVPTAVEQQRPVGGRSFAAGETLVVPERDGRGFAGGAPAAEHDEQPGLAVDRVGDDAVVRTHQMGLVEPVEQGVDQQGITGMVGVSQPEAGHGVALVENARVVTVPLFLADPVLPALLVAG